MNLTKKLKLLYSHEIVRRYVVSNSFDGALTMLGIIIANFFAGTMDPHLIVLPGVGAAIALGISGVWGAYAAETSEVASKVKKLEKHLLANIRESKITQRSRNLSYFISFVNGATPVIISFLILSPFFVASFGFISASISYAISLIMTTLILFALGVFTGFTAKENMVRKGFKMLLAGIVIGGIFFILAKFGLI